MQIKYILCTGTQELSLIILLKIYNYYDIQVSARFSDILVKYTSVAKIETYAFCVSTKSQNTSRFSSVENRVQSFYQKLQI